MSLTPDEARKVYGELSQMATEAKLKWLVEDVASEISLGKQTLQKMPTESTQYAAGDDYASKRKGKAANFVITAEYSENEKLGLLVEALEAASTGMTIAVVNVFDRLVRSNVQATEKITFAPDSDHGETLVVDRSVFEKMETALKLQVLLRELKEAI